jgi:hypothetical protein
VAPEALRVVVVPLQIETALPAVTTGKGLTVTVTNAVSLQPVPAVPITVYVVVLTGVATGFVAVSLLSVADGLHRYAVPPPAESVVFVPAQIAELALLAVTMIPLTFTVTTSVAEQPLRSVPVTV